MPQPFRPPNEVGLGHSRVYTRRRQCRVRESLPVKLADRSTVKGCGLPVKIVLTFLTICLLPSYVDRTRTTLQRTQEEISRSFVRLSRAVRCRSTSRTFRGKRNRKRVNAIAWKVLDDVGYQMFYPRDA